MDVYTVYTYRFVSRRFFFLVQTLHTRKHKHEGNCSSNTKYTEMLKLWWLCFYHSHSIIIIVKTPFLSDWNTNEIKCLEAKKYYPKHWCWQYSNCALHLYLERKIEKTRQYFEVNCPWTTQPTFTIFFSRFVYFVHRFAYWLNSINSIHTAINFYLPMETTRIGDMYCNKRSKLTCIDFACVSSYCIRNGILYIWFIYDRNRMARSRNSVVNGVHH